MENSIFQLFETIFSEDPKPPKSISVEIEVLDYNKEISDNFEILLHMFIYGFKKLKLTFSEESLSILKKYFASLDPSIKILQKFIYKNMKNYFEKFNYDIDI